VQFDRPVRLTAFAAAQTEEVLRARAVEDLGVAEGDVLVGTQQVFVLVWRAALHSGSFRSLGTLVQCFRRR
jgi:hypothetical protein